ncbi:flagellar protein G [Halomarina pelagica]|uniref:flagellar protein G n=1 Tax=Halomarina pelagica TaxID=2961599 RepID=UPI0020C1FEB3|nr:flagellar protein G [Halomarina sp. BND7]
MASVSVSNLVLFIAALTVAVGVSGTMASSVADISEALDDKSLDVSRDIDTEIEVISDAGSDAVYDDSTGTVTLLVKNTGRATLPSAPDRIDVLVDGRYVEASAKSTRVLDDSAWTSGSVLELTVDRSLAAGEHRAAVVVDGDEEVFEFHTGP